MCVYNGERYIVEQLNSLMQQTVTPNEVVVYDDGSTDDTVSIIKACIQENGLVHWVVHQNAEQKGWRFNFYDALEKSDGDIIFFCDQDDIWAANKIEVMVDAMRQNPDIFVLSGLQYLIDGEGQSIARKDIVTCGQKYDYKVTKEVFMKNLQGIAWQNRIGCAMAVRKEIKDLLQYFDRVDLFAHDTWAVNVAAILGKYYYINFPAIFYRIHGSNASISGDNLNASGTRVEKIESLEKQLAYIEYIEKGMLKLTTQELCKKEQNLLQKTKKILQKRISVVKNKRFFAGLILLPNLGYYIKYLGLKQFVADVIDAWGLRK